MFPRFLVSSLRIRIDPEVALYFVWVHAYAAISSIFSFRQWGASGREARRRMDVRTGINRGNKRITERVEHN